MYRKLFARAFLVVGLIAALLAIVACGEEPQPVLFLGGIPDQDVAVLEARFNLLAEHISEENRRPRPVPPVPVLRRPGDRMG